MNSNKKINKKIKKYVNKLEIPDAQKVLPSDIQTGKKHLSPWIFPSLGTVALAGIIVAVGLNLNRVTKADYKKSEVMRDGVIGENTIVGNGDVSEGMKEGWLAEDIINGMYDIESSMTEQINPVAGTLTGGEIKDLENWNNWNRVCDKTALMNWKLSLNDRVFVYLHNGKTPLSNIKVKLLYGDRVLYTAISDIKGNAYLLYNTSVNEQKITPDSIQIEMADGSFTSYRILDYMDSNNHIEIELTDREIKDDNILNMDLMFVVDTTGSMCDELKFLQSELQDVISRVEKETGANIRTSVNFYRDEGDEYVVKYYDFREEESEVTRILMEQSAAGGGDYEEAVHTAIDNAVNGHEWSEESTVKLMFLLLDAPPHNTDEISAQLKELMFKASEQGIRVIPIAASGAFEDTQQLLRAFAIMTGGTFIFLDDNSGVGESHSVPLDKNEYKSEYLNSMLIRIIGEYCGKNIESSPIPEKPTETPENYRQ